MRPPKPTSARLRLPRIEARPKAIGDRHFVDNVRLNEAQKSDFNRLLDLISAGTQLDERYYRSGIDTDYDELLDRHGVMHLHLESRYSDVLLFLIQYDEHIELLEINDHKHFRSKPVGHLISALQSSWLKNLDRDLAYARDLARNATAIADRAAARDTANKIEAALQRSGLRPRKRSV